MGKDFIGTGWGFPPNADGRGGIALVSDADKIAQAIKVILMTPIGQRVMRPTFGSRLHELVFAPAGPETFGLAELYVQEALTFWEPRIELLDVIASTEPERPHVMLIEIRYRIKATHDERSLVYPFYQIPGE
ncbi:MAG: GPW/gp25 family protein [Chloroflexi bacterium]|nr:GPW/gp25 family protein [Chloroflexota bacterium]